MASKIVSLSQLLAWRQSQREQGRTVVHCHGCFDIVHPGHIAHLQEARRLGDVLVVSVSSDANVNKGFARPLIPDDLRAGSLAALECVDLVYVNPSATAVGLLGQLQPDVFVKGKEYERSADPRFLLERETVVGGGGRVAFTSGDIVYSSTALIGSLSATDPFEAEKLARLRERYELTAGRLAGLVRGFEGKRVVVIGDYIRDVYHFCDATSIASEGPMMTLRARGRKDYDGGAAVIARHVAALGGEATLVTCLTTGGDSLEVRGRLGEAGIDVRSIPGRRQLVAKHRYLCDTTKVLKVDEGDVLALDSAGTEALAREVESAVGGGADAVIFADFGYGALTSGAIERVLPWVRARVPVVTADVSGRQGTLRMFRDVDLATPTERELRDCVGDMGAGVNALAWNFMRETRARNVLVTLGRQGALAFDRAPGEGAEGRLRSEHVPALCGHALDPLGCGDAMLSVASLTLAAGGSLQAATLLGAMGAAVQAGRIGNDAVSAEDVLERVGGERRGGVRLAS
jgi:rfaE bifunctional protein kinase chain/domain/rfaE bifunctional protein nucleotidyltransferase chain/domain